MEKYLRFYLGALILISLFIFGYLGLIKPLWLDELFSLQIIENDSLLEIIKKMFSGSDTNAPLYFIFLKIHTSFFGTSELALKLLSLSFTLSSLFVSYRIIRLFTSDKLDQLIVLTFFIISQGFATYLLVEVRTYSLYFLLSTLLIYFYLKMNVTINIKSMLIFIILIIALFYTHYYSFYLVFSILLYELLNQKRKKIFLSIAIGILFFSPWFLSVINQFQIGKGLVHQDQPNLLSLGNQYFFLVGKGGVIILSLVVILQILIVKNYTLKNNFLFTAIIMLIPMLNILVSNLHLSVHSPRYFVFSLIGLLIILTITLNSLGGNKHIKFLLIFLLTILTVNRIIYYKNTIEINRVETRRILQTNYAKIPIVCESPHKQYPLNYYSMDSNVFFLLDSLSAFSVGNIKNAPYDYLLLSNYKKYYALKNIMYYNDFKSMYKKFILINENDRMLFEIRFHNNPNYNIKLISKDMYLIEHYEI